MVGEFEGDFDVVGCSVAGSLVGRSAVGGLVYFCTGRLVAGTVGILVGLLGFFAIFVVGDFDLGSAFARLARVGRLEAVVLTVTSACAKVGG